MSSEFKLRNEANNTYIKRMTVSIEAKTYNDRIFPTVEFSALEIKLTFFQNLSSSPQRPSECFKNRVCAL